MSALPGPFIGMGMDDDDEFDKGMPDKPAFRDFFRATVAPGKDMTLAQFMLYDKVDILLADQLILNEDVSDMWISAVGDAEGLNEDEGYEMLCMVMDLPDPEDMKYLDEGTYRAPCSSLSLSYPTAQ